ncbi:hypothetical protein SAMN05216215_108715 [Saccharopolyspora shandongensis]|uniref:Tail terminator n=2 Tax=Saccharopolyspora shandongensis TaxID=418495 RepID=A0A1H3TLU5_9PSEU|nr:hypothetical protein SAMN05216215_108715 [Saccharopolyspora shandongensis]
MDPEALAVDWLTSQLPGVRVVVDLPACFDESLPVARVSCIGGAGQWQPWNPGATPLAREARIDVDVFAARREQAADLAVQVSNLLFAIRGHASQWGRVSAIRQESGPAWRPDYNPSVRRFGLTSVLTIRPA